MKRTAFLTLFFCFSAIWVFAQSDLQPAAIVNVIRSEPITVKQLRTEVEKMELANRRTLTQQERLQVLDVMINERLAIQAAERDRITVSENELNQQINQLRTQLAQQLGRQPTDAEFATAIRNDTGLEMAAFREQIRRQLITQKYLMEKKKSLFENIKAPTDAEILNYYNLNKAKLVRPDTIRFSMIQVEYGPDAASKTKARELADRLFREIGSNPSKFDDVAIRGQSPNSGYQAGDAGYLPLNMEAAQVVGQNFLNVVFGLKQSEVSRMIEGVRGYQIVKVTETYTQKNLVLDDIFQLGTRITVRDYVRNGLLQQRQQEALVQATQELVSELRAGRTFQIFNSNLTW